MHNNMNSMSSTNEKSKNGNGKWAAEIDKVASETDLAGMTESARKIYDQAVETGSDFFAGANKKATSMVREYPFYATLGGICVGFLLGASLFGRSQKKG